MTQRTIRLYPLEERTALFGQRVIDFCKTIRGDGINRPLIAQLVRSATSIGANYMEANGASSKKDFLNKILLCKREAQETKHWLRMLSTSNPEKKEHLRGLWKECQELTFIFGKAAATLRKNSKL